MLQPLPTSLRRSVVQCDFQQDQLYADHQHRLYEQWEAVVGPEPVEDFQYGGDEHDTWDVEGEAGAGLGAVYGEDLVGVGGYGGGNETRGGWLGVCAGVFSGREWKDVQERREPVDHAGEYG